MKVKIDIRFMAAIIIMVALIGGMIAVLYDTETEHGGNLLHLFQKDETETTTTTPSKGLTISESTAKEMNLKIEEITLKPIPIVIAGSAIISQNLDKMYVDLTAAKAGKIKLTTRTGVSVSKGSSIATIGDTRITSSESGMVMDTWVSDGDTVYAGQKIATIMNLSTVWVLADIPQDQLSGLRVGQSVNVKVDAYPDRIFTSTVAYISPTLNPNTFTASVRIVMPNPNMELKPNMTATIQIIGSIKGNGIIIPQSAIAEIGSRKLVYVENKDKTLSKRDVVIKEIVPGSYEVINGLSAGERIVTQGAYYLKSQEQMNTGGGD